MNTPPGAPKTIPNRRGFSLAALFVLVTASAVVVAGAAPLARDVGRRNLDLWSLPATMVAGLITGLILGALFGIHHYRATRGLGFGAAAGMTIGAIAGPMSLLQPNDLPNVGLAMFAGSLLIVAVAAFTRSKS